MGILKLTSQIRKFGTTCWSENTYLMVLQKAEPKKITKAVLLPPIWQRKNIFTVAWFFISVEKTSVQQKKKRITADKATEISKTRPPKKVRLPKETSFFFVTLHRGPSKSRFFYERSPKANIKSPYATQRWNKNGVRRRESHGQSPIYFASPLARHQR